MRYWIIVFSACILLLGSCNNTVPVGPEILPDSDGQGNFYNDTTKLLLETRSIAFTDSTLSESLSVAASTPIFGKVDGDNMPTNGAPFYGVTE